MVDSLLAQGSNDYGSGHIPTTELWVKAYTDFVRNVSATYSPSPEIFLTVSHCAGKNESIKCESHSKPACLIYLHYQPSLRFAAPARVGCVHYLTCLPLQVLCRYKGRVQFHEGGGREERSLLGYHSERHRGVGHTALVPSAAIGA
jgi:hypothetical protein